MKIGIDVDEVIVEFLESFLEFYNSSYNKNFKKEDFYVYLIEEIIGGTPDDAVQLLDEYGYNKEVKLVEGAFRAIKELSKSHELIILTARHPKYKEITNNFLKKYFGDIFLDILYTGEIFVKEGITKADLCKNFNIKLIIEDNMVFSFECAKKGIKVFLLDKPWNQNYKEHENISKVYHWNEILEKLKGDFG